MPMNATTITAVVIAGLGASALLGWAIGSYLTAGHGPDIDRTRR